MRLLLTASAIAACALGCSSKKDPFKPVPECMGPSIVPFMGSRAMVVSSLAIADADEGFDLDLDGKPDNKLSPLGSLANQTIMMSFTQKHDIILPIELFGYEGSDSTLHQVRLLRRPVQSGPRRRRQGHAVDARQSATATTPTRRSIRARPRI